MNTPYLNRYRNGEYLQYMKDILELLAKQDIDALSLTNQKNALEAIINTIDTSFQQAQGSAITQEIIALDERRDRAIIGFRSVIDGYTYHFQNNMATAAKALITNISSHGDSIPRMSYQEETAILNSIVKDMETEGELSQAITTLNLGSWLAELKTANQNFTSKYLERVGEAAANQSADIPQLRGNATEAYRTLITHIQAHQTLSGTAAYTTIINQVDVLAGQYNQVVDNRSNNGVETTTDSSNQ
ncbi:hypothetical protein AB832_06225 [Flavobacteriaceae bacterium (ex Bugula neritina AB1)]|nr:hypothetical protein AB832_06225 [Flavobacteriaceae bacterium (ex Bugula neritina AB1)]